MKKETLLTIAVIALLLLNLGTLGFLFLRQNYKHGFMEHGPGMHHGPDKLIVEGLKLNAGQIAQFEVLKKEHHGRMVELDAMDHEIHKGYFELLKAEKPDDKKADSLQLKMQWIVNERNTATFDHFKKLRAICKPEQKILFDQLIDEISRALHAGPGPEGPPPRDGEGYGPPPR